MSAYTAVSSCEGTDRGIHPKLPSLLLLKHQRTFRSEIKNGESSIRLVVGSTFTLKGSQSDKATSCHL